jgi:outer membrane protein TolC
MNLENLENSTSMKASRKLKVESLKLGGSHEAWAGLSAASPRANAQMPTRLWAFRSYPCRSVLFIISILFSIQAQSQVISLDSVLAIIDRQNPMLQETDNRIEALNTYASGATSWMAPMVGAGTFMRPYKKPETIHPNTNEGAWMFSIEQDIPNPSKLNANKRYLASKASVEEQTRAIQFNELRSEAKTMYYQWLVAEEKRKVLKENERIIELMIKLARIRYPYNQGSLGSIYKAEGRLNEVQNMMQMTEGEIEESSFRLKSLMNLSPETAIAIDTATQITFEANQLIYDTASLGQQRSDIRQLNKSIEAMRLNQQLQRYQARPDFRIRFDHMQSIGDMPNQFTAMAMISIPIAPWSSKMYKAEAKGMQYDIEAMKKGREAILLETRGMLAGMASQLNRMKQQRENYRTKILPALNKNYQTLMLAYEENREQLPMVIDAWEALNMAQTDYLEKTAEYYNMIVRYEKELEK